MIDEHAPHQPRRDAEEVRAILPAHRPRVGEPQKRLVHQRRRLQRVSPPLARHVRAGESAEFGLDDRKELLERRFVALAPRSKELSDLAGDWWIHPLVRYHDPRNVTCRRRGKPTCRVILPNVGLPNTPFGPRNFGEFVRFNTSSRSSAFIRPAAFVSFVSITFRPASSHGG